VALAGAAACAPGDGQLRLTFDWGELEPPEPGTLMVYGSVEGAGRSIAANGGGGTLYQPGMRVAFRDVPYGDGLQVEVRMHPVTRVGDDGETEVILREGHPEPDGAPRYFGRSNRFDFQAGDDREVRVPFSLVRGPAPGPDSESGGLRILNATNGRIGTPRLELEFQAFGAEQIEVAQALDFTVGLRTFEADAARVDAAEDGLETFRFQYDLDDALPACAATPRPDFCDSERTVLVRAVAGQGTERFEAEPALARVVLDTTPPGVRDLAFSPPQARLGTEVLLNVNATEALDEASLQPDRIFEWENDDDPGFEYVGFDGTLYRFSRVIDGSIGEDRELRLRGLNLRDRVGNTAFVPLDSIATNRLAVDTTAPDFVSFVAPPPSQRFSTAASFNRYPLEFELTEVPSDRSNIVVELANLRFTLSEEASPCSLSERVVTCAIPLPRSVFVEGRDTSEPVRVQVTDDAGNLGSRSTSVRLDDQLPEVAAASVVYVGDQTNPLPNPTQAKEMTTILVTLSFTETLGATTFAPELSATLGNERLTFTLQTPVDEITTSATFSGVVGTQSDGIYAPTVSAQDLAGNRTTSAGFPADADPIAVDNTADTLVIQQDQVSYIRSPIGNAAAETLRSTTTTDRFQSAIVGIKGPLVELRGPDSTFRIAWSWRSLPPALPIPRWAAPGARPTSEPRHPSTRRSHGL